ncbi:histidine phosphatase family protein [Thioalkalivibrio sulfidiphilus]|uniref:Phosphoglycerate mutase n=1 Tax=Thioalkalivibrio sulfidiphilus (strain HL-EbGR7) TaxID=396588 RepID=B8GLY0_THISH|nr:histidine phosphatase family protein [Thioalkalivibrio sulfidiphilus]ACL71733.1 Phosphoglycerate mutase [Thioalkalivibrio sulfidiphilus HL-EbGr7]
MLIDLLRHGEPEGGQRYRGCGIDDPLSETGWAQMRAAVQANAASWDHIITSPMRRCREFAEALSRERGIALSVEPGLREVGFGSWEGRSPEVIKAESLDEYLAFYNDPVGARPAGAEPLDAFARRVRLALAAATERHARGHLLVVAHSGVIRAAITLAMDVSPAALYRLRMPYAALTRLRVDERGMSVEFVNR